LIRAIPCKDGDSSGTNRWILDEVRFYNTAPFGPLLDAELGLI